MASSRRSKKTKSVETAMRIVEEEIAKIVATDPLIKAQRDHAVARAGRARAARRAA